MPDISPVQLTKAVTNDFGATFWYLSLNTTCDGRGNGGLGLRVDILTQLEGLRIAGNLITWDELMKAKKYAESKHQEVL